MYAVLSCLDSYQHCSMGQVDDEHFVTISLSDETSDDDCEDYSPNNDEQIFINKKRKNLEEFLGLKDVGPGIPSKEAIEQAAFDSLVYQGLTFNSVDREGRKNLSDLLGVAESGSDDKNEKNVQGSFLSLYKNAKYFSKKILNYKKNDKSEKSSPNQSIKEYKFSKFVTKRILCNRNSYKVNDECEISKKERNHSIYIFKGAAEENQKAEENIGSKPLWPRKFPHKLKSNFYMDRDGSLKEREDSEDGVDNTQGVQNLAYSCSFPIIPFNPNNIAHSEDYVVDDAEEEEKENEYSSMLFVANTTSLENIIDVAKRELFETEDENENDGDESDCDSYASICFNNQISEEVTENTVPDYLDMNKIRELVQL